MTKNNEKFLSIQRVKDTNEPPHTAYRKMFENALCYMTPIKDLF